MIQLRGVRTHNLKGFDLDLPTDALVVVTGPSGSGKSSLVFGTLLAESRRRLAVVLDGAHAPAFGASFDALSGLPVSLGVTHEARTERAVEPLLGLAGLGGPFAERVAREGVVACPRCFAPCPAADVARATDLALAYPEGSSLTVLAPCAPTSAGGVALLETLQRAGFVRVRVAGVVKRLDELTRLPSKAEVEVVIDRVRITPAARARFAEAIALAYRTSGGRARLAPDEGPAASLEARPRCVACGVDVDALESEDLRPSSTRGCTGCRGTGLREARGRGGRDELDEREACAACHGTGLSPQAAEARWLGRSVRGWLESGAAALRAALPADETTPLARGLERLAEHGLGELPLGRRAIALSTGEVTRARLAAVAAAELTSALYVFDEPTAGLHPADRGPVLATLRRLVEQGNGVVCVEHAEDVVAIADVVVELGPGRGDEGGHLLAAGPPSTCPSGSLTHALLHPLRAWPKRPARAVHGTVATEGPDGAALALPRGSVLVVTGTSGTGKSRWLDAVARSVDAALATDRDAPSLVRLDERGSVPTPRSLVATRLDVLTELRGLFAHLPSARAAGLDATAFGLTARGLRCVACEGRGEVVFDARRRGCPRCHGSRYEPEALLHRYRGATIADVLAGSIDDAAALFDAVPPLARRLSVARRLGLGHLRLGRALTSVSSGERTRLALASAVGKSAAASHVLVLDEPSRGLSARDVPALYTVLHELADAGATVLASEVTLRAIASADLVLELVRDGASVAALPLAPPELVGQRDTPTGRALRALLGPLAEDTEATPAAVPPRGRRRRA